MKRAWQSELVGSVYKTEVQIHCAEDQYDQIRAEGQYD